MKNILLSFLFIISSISFIQAQSDIPDAAGLHPQWAVDVFNIDSLILEGDCDNRLTHPNYKNINTEADELAPVISGNGSVLYFVRVEIDTVVILMDGTELIIDYFNDPTNNWYLEHVKYLYNKKDDWLQKKRAELENPADIFDTTFIQQQDIWVTWRKGSEETGWQDWEIAQKLPYPINNEFQNVVCQTNEDGTQIFLSNQYVPNFMEDVTDESSLTTTYSMRPGISVTKYNGQIGDENFTKEGAWNEPIQNIDIKNFNPTRDSHFFFHMASDFSFVIFSAHLNDRANYLEEDLYIAFNDKIDFKQKLSEINNEESEDSTDAPTSDDDNDSTLTFNNIISLGETVNNLESKTLKSRNNIITKTFRREYLPQHTFETAPFLSADRRRLYFTRVERFLSEKRDKDLTDADKSYALVSLYEIDRASPEKIDTLWQEYKTTLKVKQRKKLTVGDYLEFVWSNPAIWGEPVKVYDEFQNHDDILHTADFEAYLNLHTDTYSNFEDYGFLSLKIDSCMNADIYELDFIRGHLLKLETYALPSKTAGIEVAKKVKTEVILQQNKVDTDSTITFQPTEKNKLAPLSNTLIANNGGGKGGSNVQWFEFVLDPNAKGQNADHVLYVSLGENTEIYNHNFDEINVPTDTVKSFVSYMVDGEPEVVPDTTVTAFEGIDDAEVLYVEFNKEMIYDHTKDPTKSTAEKTAWTIDTQTMADSSNYVDVMKVYVLREEAEPISLNFDSNIDIGINIDTTDKEIVIVEVPVQIPCPCDCDCGTVVPEEFILHGVLFPRFRWDLAYEDQFFLDQVAQVLRDNPNYYIALGGYTDSRGSAEDNKRLSEQRVSSVVNYLINAGIARNRITSHSYGEASHLRDAQGRTDSEAAYARSRRVVIEQVADKANFVDQPLNIENKNIKLIVEPETGKIKDVILLDN